MAFILLTLAGLEANIYMYMYMTYTGMYMHAHTFTDSHEPLSDVERDNPRPTSTRDSALGTSVRSSTALNTSYHDNTSEPPVRGNRNTGGNYSSVAPVGGESGGINELESEWLLVNYVEKREKPLLKICYLKFKKLLTCLVVTVLLSVLLLFSGMVVGGGVHWSSQVVVIGENAITRTEYVVVGSTVCLATIDASVVSAITVREVTQYGDSSQLSNIYIQPEGTLDKYMTTLSAQRPIVYQKTASNFTSLINEVYFGIYLLETSSISYSFNIASQHSRGSGYFYIFNNKDHFSNFTSKVAGAESSAVHHKQFNIGAFNVTEPTSIEYEVEKAAYFFFVAVLPGDIYFNFSYKIEQVYLNHLDYEPTCENVYESANPCSIDLRETSVGKFYILAYVEPQADAGSPTTHLQLTTDVTQLLTTDMVLTFLGAGLLLACCIGVVLIAVTVIIICKRRQRC